MLEITCEEHLAEVRKFAKKRGLSEEFQEQLTYLDQYAEHGDSGKTKCVLGKDFAPFSFAFAMFRRNKDGDYDYWFNGGLIYFGPGDSGVGEPQYSVRIGDTSEGWSIHT